MYRYTLAGGGRDGPVRRQDFTLLFIPCRAMTHGNPRVSQIDGGGGGTSPSEGAKARATRGTVRSNLRINQPPAPSSEGPTARSEMVEAAGVEPASETPSSHEIRRLPGDPPAGVDLSFQICQPRDVHHTGVTRPTLLCWRIQNVSGWGRITFPTGHWGSRSPQTSSLRLLPGR